MKRLIHRTMSDWLHNLPVGWMALLIFGFTYVLTFGIYLIVSLTAHGERARSFKAISPGLLPPLGILFGLFVAFTAAQVWNDTDRAAAAVNREASALRSLTIFAGSFPGDPERRTLDLVRRYVEEVATREWPMMVHASETLKSVPGSLNEALRLTLDLEPSKPGQQLAQREMVSALENALDARRQRILISRSQVNFLKWSCLYLQAVCALFAIAMVHSDNRLGSVLALGLFATGVAGSALLIASHDRPFTGQISVDPGPLLEVMPDR